MCMEDSDPWLIGRGIRLGDEATVTGMGDDIPPLVREEGVSFGDFSCSNPPFSSVDLLLFCFD